MSNKIGSKETRFFKIILVIALLHISSESMARPNLYMDLCAIGPENKISIFLYLPILITGAIILSFILLIGLYLNRRMVRIENILKNLNDSLEEKHISALSELKNSYEGTDSSEKIDSQALGLLQNNALSPSDEKPEASKSGNSIAPYINLTESRDNNGNIIPDSNKNSSVNNSELPYIRTKNHKDADTDESAVIYPDKKAEIKDIINNKETEKDTDNNGDLSQAYGIITEIHDTKGEIVLDSKEDVLESSDITENNVNFETNNNILEGEEEKKIVLLVIENNESREKIYKSIKDRYRILEAVNGVDGLRKVQSSLPDAVIADYNLSKINGPELCLSIKSNNKTSFIPVVILTADETPGTLKECYDSGADSTLRIESGPKLIGSRLKNLINLREVLAEKRRENKSEDDDNNPSIKLLKGLSTADEKFVQKLKQVIMGNIDNENLEMDFIADKLAMSHSTLYRKVKSITGLSINKYVLRLRFIKAMEMLQNGEHTVVEISEATGFSTATYFRKAFKREFGITPMEFTNRHRERNRETE